MRDRRQGMLPLTRDRLCDAVLGAPDLTSSARTQLLNTINRLAGIGLKLRWPFMMIHKERLSAVTKWIVANSHRATKTLMFLVKCIELAEFDDGLVPIDRAKLSAELEVTPRTITLMLGELVRCNALIREGKHPHYRYRLNRLVGTNIAPEEIREALQVHEPEVAGIVGLWPYDGTVDGREDVVVRLRP